jgi:hypothetical protein
VLMARCFTLFIATPPLVRPSSVCRRRATEARHHRQGGGAEMSSAPCPRPPCRPSLDRSRLEDAVASDLHRARLPAAASSPRVTPCGCPRPT